MPTSGILSPRAIRLDDDSPSKKRVLEHAAELLAPDDPELSERIYERLLERERLGSTGLSGGVALPHARMPDIHETRGAFLRLTTPIDFDSLDGRPVDLVFALLVPDEATEEHLRLLADLARLFNDPALRSELRSAAGQQVFELLTRHITHDAA